MINEKKVNKKYVIGKKEYKEKRIKEPGGKIQYSKINKKGETREKKKL